MPKNPQHNWYPSPELIAWIRDQAATRGLSITKTMEYGLNFWRAALESEDES